MSWQPTGHYEYMKQRRAMLDGAMARTSEAQRRRNLRLPDLPPLTDEPQAVTPAIAEPPPAPIVVPPPAPTALSRDAKLRIVADAVCAAWQIRRKSLFSDDRARALSWPRQAMGVLVARYVNMSTPQIGDWIGRRDHSTIVHGKCVHERRLMVAAGAAPAAVYSGHGSLSLTQKACDDYAARYAAASNAIANALAAAERDLHA